MDKTLNHDAPPEQRRAAKEKIVEKIVDEERAPFEGKLGMQRSALEKGREDLVNDREELERANEEDRKIINDEDATFHDKKMRQKKGAVFF